MGGRPGNLIKREAVGLLAWSKAAEGFRRGVRDNLLDRVNLVVPPTLLSSRCAVVDFFAVQERLESSCTVNEMKGKRDRITERDEIDTKA